MLFWYNTLANNRKYYSGIIRALISIVPTGIQGTNTFIIFIIFNELMCHHPSEQYRPLISNPTHRNYVPTTK